MEETAKRAASAARMCALLQALAQEERLSVGEIADRLQISTTAAGRYADALARPFARTNI